MGKKRYDVEKAALGWLRWRSQQMATYEGYNLATQANNMLPSLAFGMKVVMQVVQTWIPSLRTARDDSPHSGLETIGPSLAGLDRHRSGTSKGTTREQAQDLQETPAEASAARTPPRVQLRPRCPSTASRPAHHAHREMIGKWLSDMSCMAGQPSVPQGYAIGSPE
jgi:hypothetical protein